MGVEKEPPMRFCCLVRPAVMAILTAAILGGLSVSPAAAQRGRPSAAQIKAYQQQMQQQQQNAYGMELVMQKRQKDVLAKYDLNGDGKLDSKESLHTISTCARSGPASR
jgi:type II secretory pathway pseudopilin PulG